MASVIEFDEQLGLARGAELLMRVVGGLMKDAERGQLNTMIAKSLGSLALVTDFPLVRKAAERLLRDAPPELLLAGAITNIPGSEKLYRNHELPTREWIEEHEFPSYDGEYVLNNLTSCSEPHIQLVIDGELTQALSHVETPLQMEEFASTCAVLGHINEALNYVRHDEFPAERLVGPLMVACVESFRRGQNETALSLLAEMCEPKDSDHSKRLILAAGFLDRVPWQGYPFPDY